jgi:hypothetical protein
MKIFSVPENIVWDNVHHKDITQNLKKMVLNGLVVLMFVFLTTPSAGIQLILHNRFAMVFLGKFFDGGLSNKLLIFVRDYITVGLTILFNLMFLYLIVVIGRNNRFTKYSRFHRFVLNYTFVYLLLNMVIIPALALSFGSSSH